MWSDIAGCGQMSILSRLLIAYSAGSGIFRGIKVIFLLLTLVLRVLLC